MMFPSGLHVPSVFGVVVGVVLGVELWEVSSALAVFVGFVCVAVGWWLSLWLTDRFFRSLNGK